jgi:TrpR family trp operon transcriptional repressor
MNSNIGRETKAIDEIAGILARIGDRKLIRDFLACILTNYEIKEIAGRWELVKMLHNGISQRKIAGRLGMSLCKITRGSKELKKQDSAFKRILDGYVRREK